MTYREIFTQFLKDLTSLDSNEPTLVIYDKDNHTLVYRQITKMIMFPYLDPFYFPDSKFEVGILTQTALNELIYSVNKLLSSNEIDNCILIPHLEKLGTSFFKVFANKELIGPQRMITFNYVNIRSKWITRLYCRYYNNNTRLLWKSYKLVKK